jgi:hypothetical protein
VVDQVSDATADRLLAEICDRLYRLEEAGNKRARYARRTLMAECSPGRLPIDDDELAHAALGSHANLGGINLELAVLGLSRISAQGLGLVANLLRLIDRLGLRKRRAGSLVFDERAHGATSSSVARISCPVGVWEAILGTSVPTTIFRSGPGA